jgi:hypothetical protein
VLLKIKFFFRRSLFLFLIGDTVSAIKQINIIIADLVKEFDNTYRLCLWFNNTPKVRNALKELCIITSSVHTIIEGMDKGEILVTFTVPSIDDSDLSMLLLHLNTDPLLWDNLYLFNNK